MDDNFPDIDHDDEFFGPVERSIDDKIISGYQYFEAFTLKTVAKKVAKLYIGEHFKAICLDDFNLPEFDEMKEWVIEELKQHFDEKIVPIIEKQYAELSDDEIEEKLEELEKKYLEQNIEQLESTTHAALRELRSTSRMLVKELKALKKKYTV